MKGKRVLITGRKLRWQMLPTPFLPRRLLAYFARQYHETLAPGSALPDEASDWSTADAPHVLRP
jgi:hypothetical protein